LKCEWDGLVGTRGEIAKETIER
uniref:Cytin chain B n=1 Tax=Theromyzon tessulatum TaxID=13286 RepID=CYTB_THETS|nr:RecName: Full=Cytin chain B [Theromyzon tessulatum]